ncbi:MAG TPA: SDR family oxidoreductase [Candidatus Latescibacteria bacterium]|jgi:NAD(P)-dependent dehydrogenase (short-subunit alcohol dehydrogenase family)|nr:3-oxoacyl-ACP reductase [Gemmatimonadota bacterium]MBU08793.1 3-oxoacyl-ACP reductase [Gemmatimonadota bacterium]MDP7362428.1 SDR family oxidoreductase [Candidatus Latescibacterota bacterium]HCV24737.1 3-oxoacyl-ACP reductase [Candidatus Latescibacterota bacterium]HJN26721.1 SDR family oxidoreductase [Candidatus Latescibacterota bacterium]|tara:strand:+ start:896 stop:1687 length:792 start_codon:yes stop_codon:yes gene_type:complete
MTDRVKDKATIVTGAGSIGPGWGNGKAAAVVYAREGALVAAVDRTLSAAEETRDIITGEGGQCIAVEADVTVEDQVQHVVDRCLSEFGRVDILHNNVGIPVVGGTQEISADDWDQQFSVNVKSMYLTCRTCLPQMVEQGSGAIVNISSIASIRAIGYPCISYAATKGAVNQLTQQIAMEYAAAGIRANCILPGLMHTPQIEHYVTSGYGGDKEEMIRKRHDLVPMKRMGTAWDVAYAALFLASDEAQYVTGTQLVVDGGITCK